MISRLLKVGGLWVGALAAWTLAVSSAAALELPEIFSDHMVLQREMPVPVWGKAQPGNRVTVTWGDTQVGAVADAEGNWRVDLPAMEASAESQVLRVVESIQDGEESQVFTDVLVGDVWHCSGQSNMGWTVANSNDAEAEIAAADYPLIRLFNAPRKIADAPMFSNGGQWQVTTPSTIGGFSAVGYFFGRKIHESQDVPIGLFATPWGGAASEAFTSMPTLEGNPATASYLEEFAARKPEDQKPQHDPAKIYNGMIYPVAPFAHRGVIWYQGENNASRGPAYRTALPLMIEDWRTLWNQPGDHRDTPFLIVQLANFREPAATPPARDNWGELRDSQAAVAASMNNAYLATAIDIGEADDIHPRNKQDVGLRLARLAERYVYGDESVVPVGPTFTEAQSNDGGGMTLHYEFAEGLRTTDDAAPRGFAIRLKDSEEPWVWAEAAIDGQTVVLTHPDGVEGPFDIRYAYGINPADGPQGINLVNGERLPAMPFRTDPVPDAP